MGVEVSNDYEQSPRLHALSITSISELISSQATFHRVTLSPVDLLCKAASSNIIIIDSQQDCSSSACLQEKPFYYVPEGALPIAQLLEREQLQLPVSNLVNGSRIWLTHQAGRFTCHHILNMSRS
jgi:hypothetical protein